MKPCRAIPTDGKDFVYGWYAKIDNSHFIFIPEAEYKSTEDGYLITGLIEVLPETVAQQVGRKDKNGREIYDGDKLQSGFRILTVVWGADQLQWRAEEEGITWPLYAWATERFEIIPPEVKEKQ